MSTGSLLQLRDVAVNFGGIRAVNGVDLDVAQGEVMGLIGPNGAGKTTLINLITGVYRPSDGSISFVGARIDGMSPHTIARRGLARTFQNIRLFRGLTVLDHVQVALTSSVSNLRTALSFGHLSPAHDATALGTVRETLERCGLWERRHHYASDLPYGLERRLEIARALALRPRLLLLDEPTAGMTDSETTEIAHLIRVIRDTGVAVLLIEHNMPFVAKACDRVTVINFGEKIAEGTAEEVRSDPRVLEAYLGEDDEQ